MGLSNDVRRHKCRPHVLSSLTSPHIDVDSGVHMVMVPEVDGIAQIQLSPPGESLEDTLCVDSPTLINPERWLMLVKCCRP